MACRWVLSLRIGQLVLRRVRWEFSLTIRQVMLPVMLLDTRMSLLLLLPTLLWLNLWEPHGDEDEGEQH